MSSARLHTASVIVVGLLFMLSGFNQFVNSAMYMNVVPPYLPFPLTLIYVTGVLKAVGGVGILVPRTRLVAGWGLILLLVAVFPANVHMALNSQQFANIPQAILLARLPLQLLIIGWVYWIAVKKRD